jgi:2-deoxy-D-gluconate 3-dehydrogenase
VPGYTASKGAIGQPAKTFSNEWADHGVQVNRSRLHCHRQHRCLRADPVRSPALLTRIPAARWGKPEDFKGAAVFLASKAPDYVIGSVLFVDGGWMARWTPLFVRF